MVRPIKVEASPHFNEIYTKLCEGVSSRRISEWLKSEYNENISHAAIQRYKNNNINMPEQVENVINQKLAIEKEVINKKAEEGIEREIVVETVASKTADRMMDLNAVAKDIPKIYHQLVEDSKDPDSPVTSKDLMKYGLDAVKIYLDFFNKQGNELNVNATINTPFDEDKLDKILDEENLL